jgi:hypothetical protein
MDRKQLGRINNAADRHEMGRHDRTAFASRKPCQQSTTFVYNDAVVEGDAGG